MDAAIYHHVYELAEPWQGDGELGGGAEQYGLRTDVLASFKAVNGQGLRRQGEEMWQMDTRRDRQLEYKIKQIRYLKA